VVKRYLACLIPGPLEICSEVDWGVSGSVGELSFAFLLDLLSWRGGVRVCGACAESGWTASEQCSMHLYGSSGIGSQARFE